MPKLKARESMASMTASVIVINGSGVVTYHRLFRLINKRIKGGSDSLLRHACRD